MSGEHETVFEANGYQGSFVRSRAEADLFACRMGEGKSAGLVWCPWYHTRENPGAHWAMIRDTWENLQRTTLKEFFEWFPDGVYGNWHATSKTWTWNVEGIVGDIIWLGMDDPADAAKLQSMALAGFGMDEPAPAAESGGISETIFDVGLTRLRQKGMKWYSAKLAENNPDEGHWTYRRFVEPGFKGHAHIDLLPEQTMGFRCYQPPTPENLKNLPPGYYEKMAAQFERAGRPDLALRFAKGEFGFQQPGQSVIPEFNQKIHVTDGILVLDSEIKLCWDFGLNPTCIITQVTPMSNWNALECYVGDGDIGTYQLITEVIKGRIEKRFKGLPISHYGDPQGKQREQSDVTQSAVKVIKSELGGRWYPGPQNNFSERRDPLRHVMTLLRGGTGLVQIERVGAKPLWHALRGGWHYQRHRNGMVSNMPKKDIHSHPGDAFAYASAVLFPQGELKVSRSLGSLLTPREPSYFGGRRRQPYAPPISVPEDGAPLPMSPRDRMRATGRPG